jgi:hypothetical protein
MFRDIIKAEKQDRIARMEEGKVDTVEDKTGQFIKGFLKISGKVLTGT